MSLCFVVGLAAEEREKRRAMEGAGVRECKKFNRERVHMRGKGGHNCVRVGGWVCACACGEERGSIA